MDKLPLMKVDEVRLRYELEPGLRDVFVEGVFDREVFLERASHGLFDRVCYEIDVVEIPDSLLQKHGLTRGNKQCVIALASDLAEIGADCSYRCLVDRDLDHWLDGVREIPRLRWTKHSSLEGYFLISGFVRSLIVTVAKSKLSDWGEFYRTFLSALGDFYALRLADRELMLNMTWVSKDRSLSLVDGKVLFDCSSYIKKVLGANSKLSEEERFVSRWNYWRRAIGVPNGASVRGHDFVELMAWAIGKARGMKNFADVDALTRLLILSAPKIDDLADVVD